MKPVFLISYSHRNRARVDKLRRILLEAGVEVLQDVLSVRFGQPISETFRDLVRRSTHILVLWSPASEKSPWVGFELGMAWALEREVWCLLSDPDFEPPKPLAHLKHLKSTQELQNAVRDLVAGYEVARYGGFDPLEHYSRDRLIYGPTGHARAVRLFGADDEYFTEAHISLSYRHEKFITPIELLPHRERILRQKEEVARARGALLFDGPNTRLIDWRANPALPSDMLPERRTLYLELGPVGWFDYEGLNEAFREQASRWDLLEACRRFVGLDEVLRDGSVSTCQLSNILDTGSVLLTRDGLLGYQRRSSRVSAVPHSYTTGVAENINRFLDDAEPRDSRKLYNQIPDGPWPEHAKTDDYVPVGVPHPFATIRRGLGEEISRAVLPYVGPNAIKLITLTFDLDVLHPNLLFLVSIDLTADQLLKVAGASPGRDYFEGQLRFVAATAAGFSANRDLLNGSWVPAGKAALFRSLELIEALRSTRSFTFAKVFELLRDGT